MRPGRTTTRSWAFAAALLPACSGGDPVDPMHAVPEALRPAAEKGLGHLYDHMGAGLVSRAAVRVEQVATDELSMTHTRVQQLHKGVPVFGGEAIVHVHQGASLYAITDTLVPDVASDITPALSEAEAVRHARAVCPGCEVDMASGQPDLMIFRHQGGDHLVYRVALRLLDGDEPTMPVLFISARTGGVVYRYDNLQTATGASLYNGDVTITTYARAGTNYLEDVPRKLGTFNRATSTRFTDMDDRWDAADQRAAVDAHFGAAKFYEYLLTAHGRRGIDGSGGPGSQTGADGMTRLISSVVHVGNRYNNAYWNGSYMSYGDGDGSRFSPLTTLDICGHEMQHGITQRTARLSYFGESGALNESWSDVFGALNEIYARGMETAGSWKVGEDAYTPGNGNGDAFRMMDDPHGAPNRGLTMDDDPDHYSERYQGWSDNGGVHINSGIGNKAFYLLAKGGTHHRGGSMTGIGTEAAARIWYKALTSYMTANTNFRGARQATLNAAAALFESGSAEHNAVASAWSLCGVN